MLAHSPVWPRDPCKRLGADESGGRGSDRESEAECREAQGETTALWAEVGVRLRTAISEGNRKRLLGATAGGSWSPRPRCLYFPSKLSAHSGQRANKVVADAAGVSPCPLDLQCTSGLTSTRAPAFVSLPRGFFCPPKSPLSPE